MSGAPLAERWESVQSGIREAAADAGRDARSLTTVVVTKFQPLELIRELYSLGVRDFGESRHQDARVKAAEFHADGLTWHFVGQLQSKKARQVATYCRVIHSLDRDSVVDAFDGLPGEAAATDVFLQVDLGAEEGRGGATEGQFEALVERILGVPALHLSGVMAVAPLGRPPRPAFARLRALSERMRTLAPDATAISAGMSGDYREAVLEGATHLRIGSAITGNRPPAG